MQLRVAGVGFGVPYRTGRAIHEGTHKEGMEPPVHVWVPSIGVSDTIFYTGKRFPRWNGDMLVASLRGEELVRLRPYGQRVLRGWTASATSVRRRSSRVRTGMLNIASNTRVQGPQVHDARIVHHGVRTLWSADRDFSRYRAAQVLYPLIPLGLDPDVPPSSSGSPPAETTHSEIIKKVEKISVATT